MDSLVTMIKYNPETIAAEAAAKIAEREAKRKLKHIWKMIMEEIQKTVKYFQLPSPEKVLDEAKEVKDEAFEKVQEASEYGITSVIGRPLKIIKHIIDFSNNILHPTDDDSKSAKLISDLKKMGLPINLVLSEKAFYPNKKETSAMGKLLSVTQDQAKMEDQLASMAKKSNSKSSTKNSNENSSNNNVPPPYTEQSNELMLKKMMAEERMRQLMPERFIPERFMPDRFMPYRRIMFGGKRKREKEPIEEIQELFGMLINHRIWMLDHAKNINKNSKKRTIKKKKMIKNPKKKGTRKGKGGKRR